MQAINWFAEYSLQCDGKLSVGGAVKTTQGRDPRQVQGDKVMPLK